VGHAVLAVGYSDSKGHLIVRKLVGDRPWGDPRLLLHALRVSDPVPRASSNDSPINGAHLASRLLGDPNGFRRKFRRNKVAGRNKLPAETGRPHRVPLRADQAAAASRRRGGDLDGGRGTGPSPTC